MGLEGPFDFSETQLVVLKTKAGKFLRINPNNHNEADPNGGTGKFAQWVAEKANDDWQFKNTVSNKYLRMKETGDIDVCGIGGPLCKFKVTGQGVKFSGKFIAVANDKIVVGKGGPFCVFEAFKWKGLK